MPTPDQNDPLASLPDTLRALAQRGVRRHYRKGTILIEEGDQGDTLFIILSGRLRAYGSGDKGREITYGTYGAGEYLGEMSLDGGPRSATVVTMEPTECVTVTRHALRQHIAEHPEFAFELLAKVIRRARAATLSTKQLALNDVYGRLSAMLGGLVVVQSDGTWVVPERITHQEFANRLGCSREMVSRILKDLEVGGYLDSVGGRYRLLRPLPARW